MQSRLPRQPADPMLRRASRTDIDALAAIHGSAFSPGEVWSRDVFDLQLTLPNVFALLHDSGGLILVRVAADEAEILTLAVAPQARRRGLGYTLLIQATERAASLGARVVFLEVSVVNIAARSLYTKIGFIEAGRRPFYYSDRSDAAVLRLDLGTAE